MPPLRLTREVFAELPRQTHSGPDPNPYLSKILRSHDLTGQYLLWGQDLKGKAGKWKPWITSRSDASTVNCHHLVVEIGCHFGDVLCQMSLDNPSYGFIGLDITLKRVYKSARKLQLHGASNACVLYFNALHLKHLFAPEELSGVVIFFPDPWNKKKRQKKHRLLDTPFITDLYPLLNRNGYIWLKTDSHEYFETTRRALLEKGFAPSAHPPLAATGPYVSSFESRFRSQGVSFQEGIFNKI